MSLGILGMGGIGAYFAKMAQALPVKKIYYHNRQPKKDAPEWVEYVPTMDELLQKSDVLSIHCPLNEHTVGLVGEKQIRMLKRGSIIINTARGKVIDEAALIKALEDGHVSNTVVHYLFQWAKQVNSYMLLDWTCTQTSRKSTHVFLNSAM